MALSRVLAVAGLLALSAAPARAQLSQPVIDELREWQGSRVQAATILGSDFGLSGASFRVTKSKDLKITKFGGGGEVGAPKPLGDTFMKWQPRVQGSMGVLEAHTNNLPPQFADTESYVRSFAIQFGGGARFWFTDFFNLAPTVMGMYGHTSNSFHANTNAQAAALVPQARALGLIDWTVDTWTVRPAVELELMYKWRRTLFSFSSEPVFFHTRSFKETNPNVGADGNAGLWENRLDVDVPLGVKLFNHELHTGGHFNRKELYGDLRDGLGGLDHIHEIHGRLVLDYLDQVWPLKWIGLGYSYLWGNTISGHSYGVDVSVVF